MSDGGRGLTFGSVCSGIEAASCAWHPLGWKAAFLSEIDPFPRAVLQHRFPEVPLHGDFTTIQKEDYAAIDVLVGGTPCQAFSVAGLRKGLADERGNLTLEFVRLAQRLRPRWLVWENVPGVLSVDGGRAFGSFLGGLAELGYGFAYRVLDAQYFGVPQRRRRVFLVGRLGDWRPPAAVLFESDGLRGDLTPGRGSQKVAAALTANGVGTCGADDNQGQAGHLVVHTLRGEGFDASEDGTGRGMPLVPAVAGTLKANNGGGGFGSDPSETFIPIAFNARQDPVPGELSGSLDRLPSQCVAFQQKSRDEVRYIDGDGSIVGALAASPGVKQQNYLQSEMGVRRLTPRECERLQGFPDDWTLVPHRGRPAADGPRYRAIGNSMAVPVMRWVGSRIGMVERLMSEA